jgi:hypothetical protein
MSEDKMRLRFFSSSVKLTTRSALNVECRTLKAPYRSDLAML